MDKYISDRKSIGDESFYDPAGRTEKLSFREHWALMDRHERKVYFDTYIRKKLIAVMIVIVLLTAGLIYLNHTLIVDVLYIHIYGGENYDAQKLQDTSERLYDRLGLKYKRRVYFDILPYYDPEKYGTDEKRSLFENLSRNKDEWDIIIGSRALGESAYREGGLCAADDILSAETLSVIPEENLLRFGEGGKVYGISLYGSSFAECYNGNLRKPENLAIFFYDSKHVRKERGKINLMLQMFFEQ